MVFLMCSSFLAHFSIRMHYTYDVQIMCQSTALHRSSSQQEAISSWGKVDSYTQTFFYTGSVPLTPCPPRVHCNLLQPTSLVGGNCCFQKPGFQVLRVAPVLGWGQVSPSPSLSHAGGVLQGVWGPNKAPGLEQTCSENKPVQESFKRQRCCPYRIQEST